MPDYSQFLKKPNEDEQEGAEPQATPESIGEKFGLTPEDHAKLEGYAKHLDTYDPREAMRKQMDEMRANQNRALDIATRGPFQDKTEEEQAFEEKHLDPLTRGLVSGGVMGGIGKVVANPIAASKAMGGKAVELFPKLKSMFQVGEHVFPAANTAEALKVKQALEAAGKLNNPGGTQLIKLK